MIGSFSLQSLEKAAGQKVNPAGQIDNLVGQIDNPASQIVNPATCPEKPCTVMILLTFQLQKLTAYQCQNNDELA